MSPRGSRRLNRGLHGVVVNALGAAIVNGSLAPEVVLAPDEIAERFGVSKTVVREGLRALESIGLISARPRIGTVVLDRDHWDFLNPDLIHWRAEGDEFRVQMRELFEVRRGLEVTAALLASERAGTEAIEAIAREVDRMQEAFERGDELAFVAHDSEFHRLLLKSAHNPVFAQFGDTVAALLHTRHETNRPTITHRTQDSIRKHRALADAIAAQDGERAQKAAEVIVQIPEDL